MQCFCERSHNPHQHEQRRLQQVPAVALADTAAVCAYTSSRRRRLPSAGAHAGCALARRAARKDVHNGARECGEVLTVRVRRLGVALQRRECCSQQPMPGLQRCLHSKKMPCI